MIREIAGYEVLPGTETAFEAAALNSLSLIERSPGCLHAELHRRVEEPQQYLLLVDWATTEHHTQLFRGSEQFTRWREAIGQYLAGPPKVGHVTQVAPDQLRPVPPR